MSETPILYQYPMSIYCQFVRLAFAEKGVAYDTRFVDTRNQGQFDPEYVKLNERAVVPTLVVGDRVVTDGVRINQFIDDEFDGPPLTPSDRAELAAMNRWVELADAIMFDALLYDQRKLGPAGLPVLEGRLERMTEILERTGSDGARQRVAGLTHLIAMVKDPAAMDAEIARARAKLVELDGVLATRPFVAGESYSLADVIWTGTLARLTMQSMKDELFGDLEHALAYYGRVQERPSWHAAEILDRMPPRPGADAKA